MYQILELPHNMAQVDPFCTNCSDSKQHVGVQTCWIPIIHSVFHCESTSVPKLAAGRSMSVEEPETFILYIHRKRTISNPNVQLCNFAGTWLGKPSHRQWMTMIRWHSVTEIYIYTCIYIICRFGGLPSWNGKEAMQKKPMQVNSLAQWIFSNILYCKVRLPKVSLFVSWLCDIIVSYIVIYTVLSNAQFVFITPP
jgi:hypothetical protein